MSNIEQDKRNQNIVMLFDEHIHSRGFNQWNMDMFNLDETQSLDPDEMLRINEAIKKRPSFQEQITW